MRCLLIGALAFVACLTTEDTGHRPTTPRSSASVQPDHDDVGWIRGWVRDPAGNPVAGARVTGARIGTGDVTTTTGDNGTYHLILQPGRYTLTVDAQGYVTTDLTVEAESGMVHIHNWRLLPQP